MEAPEAEEEDPGLAADFGDLMLHVTHILQEHPDILEDWRRRERLSMQLAHVDAHTLRDAGISEAQRFIGVHHPFD